MTDKFEPVTQGIISLIDAWEARLLALPTDVITIRRNSQNRNIKQILGHLIDSASNNAHRIIHLQYRNSPVEFPNYASDGNNDKWIAIQNYEAENWENLIQLWKYSNWHLVHIIENINVAKLGYEWISSAHNKVTLEEMVLSYPDHFVLHLREIDELINKR